MKNKCKECNGTGQYLPYGNLGDESLNYFSKENFLICKGEGYINENKQKRYR